MTDLENRITWVVIVILLAGVAWMPPYLAILLWRSAFSPPLTLAEKVALTLVLAIGALAICIEAAVLWAIRPRRKDN